MLITKIVDNNNRINQETKNCNLYVKNLPKDLTEEKMKEIFSKVGEVKSVKIDKYILQTKENGKYVDYIESKGFGFVCYNDEKDAQKAMQQFHEQWLPGFEKAPRPVLISKFMPKNERRQFLSKIQAQQMNFPMNIPSFQYPMMIPIHRQYPNKAHKTNYRKPQQRPPQQMQPQPMPNPQNQSSESSQNIISNQNNNSSNKDDEPNYEYMKSLEGIDQQKDYLGEFLFKKIEQHPIAQSKNLDVDIISRITGMILGINNIDEIYGITTNNENITSRIKEALQLLGDN